MSTKIRKSNRKTEAEKLAEINLWSRSDVGKDFIAWWKEHRHSGYATKPGTTYERYGIVPYEAWVCDRYRAEYASDRGIMAHLKFEYDAADYERWAKEAAEANDAVLAFAAAHNGREIPTEAQFMTQLRKSLATMAATMKPEEIAKDKTQTMVHRELHAAQMRRPFKP